MIPDRIKSNHVHLDEDLVHCCAILLFSLMFFTFNLALIMGR